MKRSNGQLLPKARKDDLVMRQIPGELLVYDLKRHKAFCLNDTAASIWKSCNGKRTVAELATGLGKQQQVPVDERVVWLALDQLAKSNLLQAGVAGTTGFIPVSRRSLLRAGIITAVTLPLVTMITAPVAAQAGSPITAAVCATRKHNTGIGCKSTPCTTGGTCEKVGAPADPCACV